MHSDLRGSFMAESKTNAMRILDTAKIPYEVHTYPHGKDAVDGVTVAHLTGQDPKKVYKTLVTKAHSGDYIVFVIPVEHELSLKKAAKVAEEKSVEMIAVKDINKVTGYIRGGCSPIGMKKLYRTYFYEEAVNLDTVIFSGGKIGLQIETNPKAVIELIAAKTGDLVQ